VRPDRERLPKLTFCPPLNSWHLPCLLECVRALVSRQAKKSNDPNAGKMRYIPWLQLTSYRIDSAAGKLSKLKQYPVGKNPTWIEIVDLL
jgi:hypothetical protein